MTVDDDGRASFNDDFAKTSDDDDDTRPGAVGWSDDDDDTR